MARRILRQSVALLSSMMEQRHAQAAARPVPVRSADEVLADLTAAVDRIPLELPSLVDAFAMRSATCGPHAVEVAA